VGIVMHLSKEHAMKFNILFFVAIASMAAAVWAGTPATAPSDVKVAIENFSYEPKTVTISAGTSVTWVNSDDVPHTATGAGDQPAFDSGALDTDEKFTFTFSRPGTYAYYCKVHPHMTGVVIVK
jgi:plastocyanin